MPRPLALGAPREWLEDLALAAGVGAFLGLIGPFGSWATPAELRIPYWMVCVCLGYLVMALCVRAGVALGRRHEIPENLALAVSVALAALPVALLVGQFGRLALHRGPSAPLQDYFECLAISLPLAFLFQRLRLRGAAASSPTDAVPGPPPAPEASGALLERLPARLGREVLCLQMEDHYVRVHTPLGSELVLMPLREAVAGVGDLEGLRVHRSFWVARGAVEGCERRGRNLVLRLAGGLEVPVSRAQVASLRARGWIGEPA